MPINFPGSNTLLSTHVKSFASSHSFRVKDADAFQAALKNYPNIEASFDPADRNLTVLRGRDGTWFTGFVQGAETCVLDEVLLDHLEAGQVAHLHLTRVYIETAGPPELMTYSLASNGAWVAYSLAEHIGSVHDYLFNPRQE